MSIGESSINYSSRRARGLAAKGIIDIFDSHKVDLIVMLNQDRYELDKGYLAALPRKYYAAQTALL